MEKDYQKSLKKLNLFFLSNPIPFNGQDYKKEKGPGTSDQSLFRLQSKFRKNSFITDTFVTWQSLTIQYKAVFKVFQKLHLLICASQFMTS